MYKPGLFTLTLCIIVLITMFISTPCFCEDRTRVSIVLPKVESFSPKSYARFETEEIKESSGLVKSRIHENVFWTHNDSGDSARLFAVDRDGNPIAPLHTSSYKGISIIGALHVDWEGITSDNSGNLYIGDIGNNNKDKELFIIYKINEPSPIDETSAIVEHTIKIYYPDKEEPKKRQSDVNAEALFWANNHLFVIIKTSKSRFTDLYSLRTDNLKDENPLALVASFNFKGTVTGAEASPDGKQLVVLTYNGIWLFELVGDSNNFFNGTVAWLPIRAGQCEAICFDGNSILLSNEQGRLYAIPSKDLIPLTKKPE